MWEPPEFVDTDVSLNVINAKLSKFPLPELVQSTLKRKKKVQFTDEVKKIAKTYTVVRKFNLNFSSRKF